MIYLIIIIYLLYVGYNQRPNSSNITKIVFFPGMLVWIAILFFAIVIVQDFDSAKQFFVESWSEVVPKLL